MGESSQVWVWKPNGNVQTTSANLQTLYISTYTCMRARRRKTKLAQKLELVPLCTNGLHMRYIVRTAERTELASNGTSQLVQASPADFLAAGAHPCESGLPRITMRSRLSAFQGLSRDCLGSFPIVFSPKIRKFAKGCSNFMIAR